MSDVDQLPFKIKENKTGLDRKSYLFSNIGIFGTSVFLIIFWHSLTKSLYQDSKDMLMGASLAAFILLILADIAALLYIRTLRIKNLGLSWHYLLLYFVPIINCGLDLALLVLPKDSAKEDKAPFWSISAVSGLMIAPIVGILLFSIAFYTVEGFRYAREERAISQEKHQGNKVAVEKKKPMKNQLLLEDKNHVSHVINSFQPMHDKEENKIFGKLISFKTVPGINLEKIGSTFILDETRSMEKMEYDDGKSIYRVCYDRGTTTLFDNGFYAGMYAVEYDKNRVEIIDSVDKGSISLVVVRSQALEPMRRDGIAYISIVSYTDGYCTFIKLSTDEKPTDESRKEMLDMAKSFQINQNVDKEEAEGEPNA